MDSIDHIRPAQRTSSTNSSSTTATTTTSELFICFTSRLSSSSSMKISSKSILSPGRARDSSQISLSTSLSRRLRTNGSLKGGQASPMFPSTNAKKRGCASFENPEPSSPKVTCIGQVRVKTKKHGNKMRARSKSRRGEVSFRKTEQINTSNTINTSNGCNNNNTHGGHSISNANGNSHLHYNQFQQPPPQECLSEAPRNQRWVHFPVTICEALRTFGAEFNCFLPCRSSCMARGHKEDKSTVGSDYRSGSNHGGNGGNGNNTSSSCGAVFARWLVAEKIELVMGKEDEDEEVDLPRRSQRRHVFEDIVIEDDVNNGKFGGENEILKRDEVEEEKGRVSACVPPKNALLLMRCRSDPVKMAALANRSWECPVPQEEEEEEENGVVKEVCGVEEVKNVVGKEICGLEEEESGGAENQNEGKEEEEEDDDEEEEERLDSCQVVEEENRISVAEVEVREEKKELEAEDSDSIPDLNNTENVDDITIAEINGGEDADLGNEDELDEKLVVLEGETKSIDSVSEVISDPKMGEEEMEELIPANEDEIETIEDENDDVFDEVEEKRSSVYSSSAEQESEVQDQKQDLLIAAELADDKETDKKASEKEGGQESTENDEISGYDDPEMSGEGESGKVSKERESQKDQNLLPDCLLLMMCEPKLSMEVSKETWVCSTDFIRWQLPDKKPLPPPPPPPLPELVVKKTDDGDESKRRISIDSNPGGPARHKLLQPPRSSCSFPVAPPMFPAHNHPTPSMNIMKEQKLVGGKPSSYEPFMLTRCKSEPMRTAASKLAPDACFWKNRKLELHRPTTCGVGAAGVGF